MITVVTIAREYGSGGAELGQMLAAKLGWELLDRQLVDRVARVVGVDPKVAASLDEHAHRWWQWAIAGMSYAAPCAYGSPEKDGVFEGDALHDITMRLIQRAADSGKCVIVGRGAQCFLQGRTDVLNVLAYAPIHERIRRLRARQPDCVDFEALIKQVDGERASYIRQCYRRDWLDKSLYDLCINTEMGLDVAAQLITTAIGRAKQLGNLANQQPHCPASRRSNRTVDDRARTWQW
ncbi:MAG: cytidylate kinase-like family protein [Acidobacteriia bacterium]|nr:cytidylate kinase-like family protein [Terriglobia bacterium]